MKKLLLLLLIIFCSNLTYAQGGAIDTSFNPSDLGFGIGDGASNDIRATGIQSDGKIIIGGVFTTYDNVPVSRIARLNVDGSLDSSFNVGTGANSSVFSIAIQADGKILIGGGFTTYNGTTSNRIVRLNTDGTIDTSFNVGTGANNTVSSIAIQADGKILIGGGFLTYNGGASSGIIRLNSDGSIDASFNVGTGANNAVSSIAIQADGKILIGGRFTLYNGAAVNRIIRLNPDGSLDISFTPGTGPNNDVETITTQADGKIIFGGHFTLYNGVTTSTIARLNSDGTLDTSFISGSGADSSVYSIATQMDGKIIIGGLFDFYNGAPSSRIARLNTDGSVDTSFNLGNGFDSGVYSITVLSNAKIIIGGGFIQYSELQAARIARLNADGTLDTSFNPGFGANGSVDVSAIQGDGKIIIGGDFGFYNGVSTSRIARLNTDGTLDTSFNSGSGANSWVQAIAIQADGKIIIGGYFSQYNGVSVNKIVRLNTDGTIDASFNDGVGSYGQGGIELITVQSDGKILIGNSFNTVFGAGTRGISRLNADGTLDTSFNIGTGIDGAFGDYVSVQSIIVQTDGKIIFGGGFSLFNGASISNIARVNSNGTLDTSFNVGTGLNGTVSDIELQSDGKIIIAGFFTNYNGAVVNRIGRLNTDGTLDASFNAGIGPDNTIISTSLQADEKIVIGGAFSTFNGATANKITRVNTDGTLDTSFNVAGSGAESTVSTTAIQADGKVIFGGSFLAYNGTGRNRIARLHGVDLVPAPEMDVLGNAVSIVSGDITPDVADDTDFGNVIFGNFLERTFTIENTGDVILDLNGATLVEITGSSDFSVTINPAATVAVSGGTTTFTVRYTPSSGGADTATLSIANTDADENPYTFDIAGISLAPFITTWKTDNPGTSNPDQITIPVGTGTFNYTVDWGDGNIEAGLTASATHTYAVAGTYTVTISGQFPHIYINDGGDKEKILTIEKWGTQQWTSMNSSFKGCINLQSNASDVPNLSLVTDMSYMFNKASAFNGNLSAWDVSIVTNMDNMFNSASVFNSDVSGWNVGAVTNMSFMFNQATAFNQPIGIWNVSAVLNMHQMFGGTTNFNQAIGAWDVSNVTDMAIMFWTSGFNQPLNTWNVGNVNTMQFMFSSNTNFNQDLSAWDVSKVTNMSIMFSGATAFNQPLSNWNVAAVADMSYMFQNASLFKQDLSTWNVGAVQNMQNMFTGAAAFNQDISGWDVSQVTNMSAMFATTAFDQNLGGWDISAVTDMSSMFANSTLSLANYDSTLIGWNTLDVGETQIPSTITFSGGNSQYCTGEAARTDLINTYGWTITDGGKNCPPPFITTWKTDNPGTSNPDQITIPVGAGTFNYDVDWGDGNSDIGLTTSATHTYLTPGTYTVTISGQFPHIYFNDGGDKEKILTIENWGPQQWTSMNSSFEGCINLQSNATDFPDLSLVTDMSYMFEHAAAFNGNLSAWDVSTITDMSYMFNGATVFNSDVSAWNVSAVTNMSFMFNQAATFNQPIGIWNVSGVLDMQQMFGGTTNFNQPIGTWNVSNVTNMATMFWSSNFNQPLNTWNVGNVNSMRFMFASNPAFNQDLSAWDVSKVTNMSIMFSGATAFNQPLSNWNVAAVTDMSYMFQNASLFNQDLSTWNVGAVQNMQNMFSGAVAFNQDINDWNVSQVANMSAMFASTAFDQNLGGWDISAVTDMSSMFANSTLSLSNYDSTLIGWNTLNVGETQIPSTITLSGGNSQYCTGEAARTDLINTYGWTITDGGLDCTGVYFVSTWKTDNPGTSNPDQISIGVGTGTFDFTVDWGDGNIESGLTANATHTYAISGTYTVKIAGTFPHVRINAAGDSAKLLSIEKWGSNAWTSMVNSFAGCVNLMINAVDVPNLSGVTDMSGMFGLATGFDSNTSINTWNVSTINNMSGMFNQAATFNQDISAWNVVNVTNMANMFNQASSFNQNIGNWDVGNVTDMNFMFFTASAFNQDLGLWNVAKVTDMSGMFYQATLFDGNISAWDVSAANNTAGMFFSASSFNQDLGSWDVSNVNLMMFMFNSAAAFDQDLGAWDISNLANAQDMFANAGLSIANYDSLLNGWSNLDIGETQIPSAVIFSGGNSQYCNGEAARADLVSTYGWTITDAGKNCAEVAAKIMLQGAALNPFTGEESLMRDDLRVAGLIPTTSPYADAAVAAATVFSTGGTSGTGLIQDDLVDWIWLELRDANTNTTVVASQSAFVQRDGDIVGLDGVSTVNFNIGGGDFYLTVHHRNHLAVMTGTAATLSSAIPAVDFTIATAPITFGTNAQSTFGMQTDVLGMFAGNTNGNTIMNYQGAGNDTNTIKDNVIADAGAANNLHTYSAYDMADVDMDGNIVYQGASNDSNRIKDIILSHPDNATGSNLFTVTEQLPEN